MGVPVAARRPGMTKKLASEILTYFLRNPQSCDDLEGVTRWRLPDQRIYETMRSTKNALDWLVREGFLVKESRPWCGDIYRLNVDMQGKANSFIANLNPESEQNKQADSPERPEEEQ